MKPKKSNALATSIDLMPTLLNAAGIIPPVDLPGIDLFDKSAVRKRDTIFGECYTHDIIDLAYPAKSLRWNWCIDGNWKIIVPDKINEPDQSIELYDLSKDPFEQQNLAAKEPRRVKRLMEKVEAHRQIGTASSVLP